MTLRSRFADGLFLVMPTTYEPGQEATFIFRVLCRAPGARLKVHDSAPLLLKSPMVQGRRKRRRRRCQNNVPRPC